MSVHTSATEQSWAVLGLCFGTKRKSNIGVQYRRLKVVNLLYLANQSAHIRACFHGLSFKWMVFNFCVAFPKLCNWFKTTNQTSNILFLLSNQNKFLRGLHLFSNTSQQWRVFGLHSDWLFYFRCAREHYDLTFYDGRWKTVLLVYRKQGDLF